jgi:hypothetical protein
MRDTDKMSDCSCNPTTTYQHAINETDPIHIRNGKGAGYVFCA